MAGIRNLTLTEPAISGIAANQKESDSQVCEISTQKSECSRLVFTGDSAGSNQRLWSGHPEAIQIAVHQSVEKIPEHLVTNRRVGLSTAFSQKHWGLRRFCQVRFWKIPGQILRFYYSRQRPNKTSP